MKSKNRYAEALKEDYNVIGLCGAVAISLFTLNPLPLLAAVVAEVVYLVMVPDMKWYTDRLAVRYDGEIEKHRDEVKARILPNLTNSMQKRFAKLEEVREDIDRQAHGIDNQWLREVVRKLDFLMDKFLEFGAKESQFRNYLWDVRQELFGSAYGGNGKEDKNWIDQTVKSMQGRYDDDLKSLQERIESETEDSSKAILEKRQAVLIRRREFIPKLARILGNLNNQLELLEDTFGLISEEIMARPPEQILSDIDDVVIQTNTMTDLLDEMAPLEQAMKRATLAV